MHPDVCGLKHALKRKRELRVLAPEPRLSFFYGEQPLSKTIERTMNRNPCDEKSADRYNLNQFGNVRHTPHRYRRTRMGEVP